MPTYDYVCQNCEHEFEHFQSMSSKPLKKCPECGKLQLKRLIGTGAGIIFKGSGFYETDYRSSDYKQKAKQEKDGGATTSDSSNDNASKSESKSASDSSSTGSTNKSETSSSNKSSASSDKSGSSD